MALVAFSMIPAQLWTTKQQKSRFCDIPFMEWSGQTNGRTNFGVCSYLLAGKTCLQHLKSVTQFHFDRHAKKKWHSWMSAPTSTILGHFDAYSTPHMSFINIFARAKVQYQYPMLIRTQKLRSMLETQKTLKIFIFRAQISWIRHFRCLGAQTRKV